MIRYREEGEETIKETYEEIGWSVLDCATIYKRTSTRYSIAKGFIGETIEIVNKDGSKYLPTAYRNFCNGFTAI